MVFNVHRNHKAFIRDGEGRRGEGEGRGKREIMYLSLHCHHQNDSMSDESHFNVSDINCEGQSHKTMSTDHNF